MAWSILQVEPQDGSVLLRLQDEQGEEGSVQLLPNEAGKLAFSLAAAAAASQGTNGEEDWSLDQTPIYDAVDPPAQMGLDDEERAVLVIGLYPFPPLRVRFTQPHFGKLLKDLMSLMRGTTGPSTPIH